MVKIIARMATGCVIITRIKKEFPNVFLIVAVSLAVLLAAGDVYLYTRVSTKDICGEKSFEKFQNYIPSFDPYGRHIISLTQDVAGGGCFVDMIDWDCADKACDTYTMKYTEKYDINQDKIVQRCYEWAATGETTCTESY